MSRYLLDADVFIDAHRHYYSFDIRPSFWDWLERKHEEGFVFSIKEVYDELCASEDELSEWAEKMSMGKFFKEADDVATINKMEELRNWANTEKFTKEAVGEFYSSADLLLVAYAKAHNFIVATNEVYDGNIKKRVKIPNACKFIGVEYVDTFQLLRKVGVGKSVIAGYLQTLGELTSSKGNYAYRGQENAEWGVESGAFRRLKHRPNLKNIHPQDARDSFISFHEEELLEPARMDGHGVEDGRELSDLELLANLQHHGAATCLIDFTRNFLVAMWFACWTPEEKDSKGKDEKEEDGKIFILDTNHENFLPLEKKDLKEDLKKVLTFQTRDETTSSKKRPSQEKQTESIPEPLWWHWSPHGLNERILKQDSLFIFGQPKIENMPLKEIKIRYQHKIEIWEELERLGITEGTLFKDLPGFAETHRSNSSLPIEYGTPKYYFQKGNKTFKRGDCDGAIVYYSRVIKLEDDLVAEAYNKRGVVKASLENYSGAIADYDEAIKLKPDLAEAHKNRADAKSKQINEGN